MSVALITATSLVNHLVSLLPWSWRKEVKPYHYNWCDTSFSRSCSFTTDKRRPTRMEPYHDQPQKLFSQSNHLVIHERTHARVKPYRCDQCNKSFSQFTDLITHKRTHTGVRPYHCNQCDKSFHRADHLVVHKRVHTAVKPYHCDRCHKSFR